MRLLHGDKVPPHTRVRSFPVYWLAALVLLSFGLYLRSDALHTGFIADDLAQLAMIDHCYPLPRVALSRSRLNLFEFSDGSEREARALFDSGFYPWFTARNLRLSMFRPIASATIAYDHDAFGSDAFKYHLHSALAWLGMLLAIAYLFRTLLPTLPALLALAFVCCDEAHGVLLAWIANRAAIISTAFGALALVAYIRWRRDGGALRRGFAIACFAIALGYGEYALCALGYFVAYECLRAQERIGPRLRALSPLLFCAGVFLVLRALLGDTPRHSGVYIDPLTEPSAFLAAIPVRLPVLISDLVLGARGEYWTFGLPWSFLLYSKGLVSRTWLETPAPWRSIHLGLGVLACALFLGLCGMSLRANARRELRFLALGCVLALVPVIGSFPSSRLVLLALIGFAPLLALFVCDALAARSISLRALALFVAGYHLLLPCYLSYTEVRGAVAISARVREAALAIDIDERELPQKDVVLMSALEGGTSMYVPLARLRLGHSLPHSYSVLSMTSAPYRLARSADRVLDLQFEGRIAMLGTAAEQLLRSPREPLELGKSYAGGPFRVTVLGLYDGRPQKLKIEFDRSLDDPSLVFVSATRRGIRRFSIPKLGESVLVPAPVVPGL